ncbi:helix-turn-helix domain-containing protein [Streptomyces tsukubensis]|uniref:helix-turn-helix domain-containing protein n=1 Tax=Streptomyces tsukubensis TaxID=83656 RepID=UPI001E3AD431|nr:helix-turn-helix domain-containing protein [Streptomyces tsukubensis]
MTPAPVPAEGPQDRTAVRRLIHAAAHSSALLIAEAAALTGGWAVLVDPLAGAVHSTPASAAPSGVRGAAHPRAHPHLTVRPVAGAVLVVSPGRGTPVERTELIAATVADLLRVQARRADETRAAEQRLHRAVLRLLRDGHHRAAFDVLGGTDATHATVYRLTGTTARTAHQALWRALRPGVERTRVLVCAEDTELTVLALHDAPGDPHPAHGVVTRIAEQYRLTGGAAPPVALDLVPAAWAEAGRAHPAPAGGRLAAATGLGEHDLLRIVPAGRLAVWSAAVLQPLDRERRRILAAWLRTGSAQAAAPAVGLSEGTVRARLREIGPLLAADLGHPTIAAQLLLAVRASAAPAPASALRPVAAPALPAALLGAEEARDWAAALLAPLDTRLRIALRLWLGHRGRTAPAAAELGVHRTTLGNWLAECGDLLDLDPASVTVRAQLHLAAETVAGPDDVPSALPRRGGRTYRAPQQ